MTWANTVNAYKEAAKIFEVISGYKDAADLARECHKRAEEARRKGELEKRRAEEEKRRAEEEVDKYKKLFVLYKWAVKKESLFQNIKAADDELNKLNNELSGLGFFNAIRKKELSEKIDEIAKKKHSMEKEIAELETNGETFSEKPSGTLREELSRYALGREMLSNYDKFVGIKIGDSFTFGSYGRNAIEWQVLEKQDHRILVISKYGIDNRPYNQKQIDVTWETCSLRRWLNSDFIKEAFTKEEMAMIQKVNVPADKNPKYKYKTNPGNATQDLVFLLGITEVNKYFSTNSARQCKPTDYAISKKIFVAKNGNCFWWVRSPGLSQNAAAKVIYDGTIMEDGNYVQNESGIRPAMWIDLDL